MDEKSNSHPDEGDPNDTLCGLGSCKPRWLQRLATGRMYMLAYGWILLCHGMIWTYLTAVLSTLEKRFAISSKQSGFCMSGADTANMVAGPIVAYLGNKGHRPRWIVAGMLLNALSSFVLVMLQLLQPADTALLHITPNASSHHDVCLQLDHENGSLVNDVCAQHEEGISSYTAVALLFMAIFLHGLSIAPLETLAWTYLDDSVPKTSLPAYLGITLGLRTIGPTFGFVLGGITLRIYQDLNFMPDFDASDPRWMGAWWLGFLVIGIAQLMSALPMMLFPRELSSHRENHLQKQQQQDSVVINEGHVGKLQRLGFPNLKELPPILKSLATNRLFVATTLEGVIYWLGFCGFTTFLPKYIETQFGLSASNASYVTGLATVLVMTIGFVGSGFVIQNFQPRARTLSGISLGTGLAQVALLMIGFTISCEEKVQMQGTPLADRTLNLVQSCNINCMCSTDKLSPVCEVATGTSFFSACHMGCAAYNASSQIYESCTCATVAINDSIGMSAATEEVTSGFCPVLCTTFVGYVVLLTLLRLLSSCERIGGTLIFLRSVKPHERNMALGVANLFYCLGAFVPCSVVYGTLIDTTCLVWEQGCKGSGNCWFYDIDRFRYVLHGFSALLLFLSNGCQAYIFYASKNLELYDVSSCETDGPTVNPVEEEEQQNGSREEEEKVKAV